MRILGLDPGTATTGYGVIEAQEGDLKPIAFGVIETAADWPVQERLLHIYRELGRLLAEFRPDTAGIEELFFGRNITTAIAVGQARGVLLLALAQAGIPIGEYSPPKIKQAVTGYGNADKAQMQLMVSQCLKLDAPPRPDDAADGLAVAITHYAYYRYATLTENHDRQS